MQKGLVVWGFCAAAALAASAIMEARAQQAPAAPPAPAATPQPLPPGSPLLGRPDTEAAKKLAPVAPPPVPTAADKLPLDKLKVKGGFKIELYAAGVPNARALRRGAKGTVFVSSRLQDKIHAIVEKDGKREVKVMASSCTRARSTSPNCRRSPKSTTSKTISTIHPNQPSF
jgi:hypothetical protein